MTKRDKILLGVLALTVFVFGILLFVFIPANNRIDELNFRLLAEEQRLLLAQSHVSAYNAIIEEIAAQLEMLEMIAEYDYEQEYMYVPYDFDPLETMRLIQRVLYPHTTRITLNFSPREHLPGTENTYLQTLSLEFASGYYDVLAILYTLLYDGPPHRIATYTIVHSPPGLFEGYYVYDRVTQEYVFVTDQFGQLTVSMEVDFLSRFEPYEIEFDVVLSN